MSFMVDPSKFDESSDGDFEREQYALEGKKVLQCVGTYKATASTGTEYYRCKFVVLNDLENQGDEGNVVWKNFFLSEKAVRFLLYFTKSMGHRSPFDASQEAVFDAIAKSRPFVGELVGDGDYGPDINRFHRANISDLPDGMDEMIKKSTVKFEDWADWKKNGGSSNNSSNNSKTSFGSDQYGDIPF